MHTRADKLVALAKMRQDWRNVNDCINDDLTEVTLSWSDLNSPVKEQMYDIDRALGIIHKDKITRYERLTHSFKRQRYENRLKWAKDTLLELSWLKEEIIRLEKELYYK
ncbi:hypothetical protein CKS97_20025 [Salmonella enterica subsp. enterica serovar Java]|nr:hypothetical protein [Salmonella enterica subsp. enterica serovar Java]